MTDKCTGLPWHQQRQVHNRCRMSHTHFCCISAAGSVSAGVGRGAHKQVDLAPWIKPFAQHRCTWWQQHRQVDIFVAGNLPVPSTGVPVDNNTGQLFSFDIGSLPRNISHRLVTNVIPYSATTCWLVTAVTSHSTTACWLVTSVIPHCYCLLTGNYSHSSLLLLADW